MNNQFFQNNDINNPFQNNQINNWTQDQSSNMENQNILSTFQDDNKQNEKKEEPKQVNSFKVNIFLISFQNEILKTGLVDLDNLMLNPQQKRKVSDNKGFNNNQFSK